MKLNKITLPKDKGTAPLKDVKDGMIDALNKALTNLGDNDFYDKNKYFFEMNLHKYLMQIGKKEINPTPNQEKLLEKKLLVAAT